MATACSLFEFYAEVPLRPWWGPRRDGTLHAAAVFLGTGFPPDARRGEGSPDKIIASSCRRCMEVCKMAELNINGRTHRVDVDPDTPLLWVLRDTLGLTGTKYGCGIAQCGACTVHVDGIAMRSCSVPLSAVEGRQITTIEGLAQNGVLHKVQQAWLDHDVPQCGYCQCGMIMA